MGLAAVWVVLFSLFSAFDVFIAVLSFTKRTRRGVLLGVASVSAAVVTFSYLLSVFTADYFWYSVLSSVYFMGIDVALVALLMFVRDYVSGQRCKKLGAGFWVVVAWGIVDVCLLACNPFHELVISYTYVGGLINHYSYVMHAPYQAHLAFAYVNIVVIVGLLVRKIAHCPSVYRRQYVYAIATLALVVGINLLYLFPSLVGSDHPILDYSLLGYSVAGGLFYAICFMYREHGMMNTLRGYIVEGMNQGVLLFDYERNLLIENDQSPRMLKGFFDGQAPTLEGMAQLLPSKTLEFVGDGSTHVFHCYPDKNKSLRPLVCEYRTLLGGRRGAEILGYLFMLSELGSDFDTLTGFYAFDALRRHGADRALERDGVAFACDINDLSGLNATQGHDEGDRAIQRLARLMIAHLPEGALFVRENDAVLVAVCEGCTEAELRVCVEQLRDELAGAGTDAGAGAAGTFDFQDGMSGFTAGTLCSDAVEAACEALRISKLLDPSSRRSEFLYSLVRMLQAVDPDTEAHVRRTQRLGMKLGQRIGLTEGEQSNLALLAILHDIGKTSVPLDILNKPGKLTEAERRVLMAHVTKGYEIAINSPELSGIADMILYHHERWDGKGYPKGLCGESTPLLSRVISVVDSYDAMTNDRPYRKAITPVQACQELERCAGAQFDPTIVAAFVQVQLDDGVVDAASLRAEAAEGEVEEYRTLAAGPAEPTRFQGLAADGEGQGTRRVHVLGCTRYVLGATYRIVDVDEEFTRITGYTREDVLGAGLAQVDLIFEEDRDEYQRLVKAGFDAGSFIDLEHWVRRKDGTPVYVSCSARKYYSSAERAYRYELLASKVDKEPHHA